MYLNFWCSNILKALFFLDFINVHISHYNSKAFYLEPDLISSENLACFLRLRSTILGFNDGLDSFWFSRIYDFHVICFHGVPCVLVISPRCLSFIFATLYNAPDSFNGAQI